MTGNGFRSAPPGRSDDFVRESGRHQLSSDLNSLSPIGCENGPVAAILNLDRELDSCCHHTGEPERRLGPEDASTERSDALSPTGERELALVRDSGWKAFPPRLPDQPFLLPGSERGVRHSNC